MQVLLTSSDEGEPGVQGLNVVPGRVRRFPAQEGLKVPQIGWNDVRFTAGSPAGRGSDRPAHDLFPALVLLRPGRPSSDAAATTDYGVPYCSALHRGNVWATQFHPEKSGPVGLTILRNFSALPVSQQ